jgi:hypothetical protein
LHFVFKNGANIIYIRASISILSPHWIYFPAILISSSLTKAENNSNSNFSWASAAVQADGYLPKRPKAVFGSAVVATSAYFLHKTAVAVVACCSISLSCSNSEQASKLSSRG